MGLTGFHALEPDYTTNILPEPIYPGSQMAHGMETVLAPGNPDLAFL